MKQDSSLLINEDPLQVCPSLAKAVGLNEAIVLQQLHYWLKRSSNERAGRKWVFNDYDDWSAQFPFWSTRTIQRIFLTLEKLGVVIADQPSGQDRRKWYALDYDKLAELEPLSSRQVGATDNDKLARSRRQLGTISRDEVASSTRQVGTILDKDSETTPEITAETTTEEISVERASPRSPVCAVFEHWREKTKRAKAQLTPERERAIRARLKDYSVEDIKRAIDGCCSSPFNMGENERHRAFNDLTLICRNGSKLEEYMAMAEAVTEIQATQSVPPKRDLSGDEIEEMVCLVVDRIEHGEQIGAVKAQLAETLTPYDCRKVLSFVMARLPPEQTAPPPAPASVVQLSSRMRMPSG
jgi:chorismate mutase